MATQILMPKQGNSVESCIIVEWFKQEGDTVSEGEAVCEVETDKATVEVESPAGGTLLKIFFQVDDDVPVHTLIAVIGDKGEDIGDLKPEFTAESDSGDGASAPEAVSEPEEASPSAASEAVSTNGGSSTGISPRARNLAAVKGVSTSGLSGSGPGGRIIERDILAVSGSQSPMTPAAIAEFVKSGKQVPASGSGIGGRILASDLEKTSPSAVSVTSFSESAGFPGSYNDIPVKGVRKITAARMAESLATTAQLTMNASADATELLAYRKQLKNSPADMGLQGISINDLLLFAVSRVLGSYPELNAHWMGKSIRQFERVHLGMAVDTDRGLMVPVIRNADFLTLKQLAVETKRLVSACRDGSITSDELKDGTFTISNLGAMGIESFTPVLNVPQVAILGVGNIQLKPVQAENEVIFKPHMGLSITIDHQAVDGAPGARFMNDLTQQLAQFSLVLAG